MPIYEFHCEKCNTDSEILLRSHKWEGVKCPQCGSTRLTKKLSVFSASTAASASAACPASGSGGGCGCCCAAGGHRH